ncbi:unnamed protein product, partial [Trichogramma brassicae]
MKVFRDSIQSLIINHSTSLLGIIQLPQRRKRKKKKIREPRPVLKNSKSDPYIHCIYNLLISTRKALDVHSNTGRPWTYRNGPTSQGDTRNRRGASGRLGGISRRPRGSRTGRPRGDASIRIRRCSLRRNLVKSVFSRKMNRRSAFQHWPVRCIELGLVAASSHERDDRNSRRAVPSQSLHVLFQKLFDFFDLKNFSEIRRVFITVFVHNSSTIKRCERRIARIMRRRKRSVDNEPTNEPTDQSFATKSKQNIPMPDLIAQAVIEHDPPVNFYQVENPSSQSIYDELRQLSLSSVEPAPSFSSQNDGPRNHLYRWDAATTTSGVESVPEQGMKKFFFSRKRRSEAAVNAVPSLPSEENLKVYMETS